jgi:hypothetical protein
MKPNKDQIEAYKEMAKTSPDSKKSMIEANLKATCDKYAGHEDRLDDCMDYLTECAREILDNKSGEVDNETCYRICRDYFNDELWKEADAEKAEREAKAKEKAEKAEAKKKAAEAKKAAAEARKAEIARKKAEALAKKKAEEERKAAELKRMKEEAEREAKAAKEAKKAEEAKKADICPGQLDFFGLMGV